MEALTTTYQVIYNQKDITQDISNSLINITYRDKVEGESDEVSLTFEDVDNVWIDPWYSEKGDTLEVKIGKLDCGIFEIDDISYKISPASITISGLAASFLNKQLRTERSFAHENKSLSQIIDYYAVINKLDKIVQIRKNIIFERNTQDNVTDLSFLKSLAKKYGYIFSIRGSNLIFWDIFELEGRDPVIEFFKQDFQRANFRDKISEIYAEANLNYHNPSEDLLISVNVKSTIVNQSSDFLELKTKVENKGQAEEIAKSELYKKNTEKITGNIDLQGNELLVSGVNIQLKELGKYSGIFHVKESTHKINKGGGYITTVSVKKV